MCRLYSQGPDAAYLRLCSRTGRRGTKLPLRRDHGRLAIGTYSCSPEGHLEQYDAWVAEGGLICRTDLPRRGVQ